MGKKKNVAAAARSALILVNVVKKPLVVVPLQGLVVLVKENAVKLRMVNVVVAVKKKSKLL